MPARVCEELDGHAAVKAAYAELGGVKRVAHLTGLSASTLYGYQEPGSGQSMPLRVLETLAAAGSTALVRHLCAIAGGTFRPDPVAADAAAVVAQAAVVSREVGEALGASLEAAADGRITPHERRRAGAEIDEAIDHLLALKSAIADAAPAGDRVVPLGARGGR